MHNLTVAKKMSEAVQKVIPHTSQYSLPVSRVDENAGNGHCTRHCAENDEEVSFPVCRCRSRHELHPLFHQAHNSFSDTGVGASHLRRKRRNRAAEVRTITVLSREIPTNDFLPPFIRPDVL